MAVTGAIFKALTFNGESSRNYGVYITGEAVYNAPSRDVEMITIPGRNGSFPLDHGRFENIEVTYPAGVFADNEADFADAISDFRNMLCSASGYCRLEDEYNPDEYRLAVYKSGLEVEPAALKAGEFDITFECKPQRYLKSGETEVTIGASTTLTNPSRFASFPEIQVKGDGIVAFNGYEVDVIASGYGIVPLFENAYRPYGWEFILGTDEYANNGDEITVKADLPLTLKVRSSSYKFKSATVTTTPSKGQNFFSIIDNTSASLGISGLVCTFTKGETRYRTYTVAYDVTVAREGLTDATANIELVFHVNYIANSDLVSVTISHTITPSSPLYYNTMNTRPTISAYVDGSKSILGDPTIIDCENGEAYKVTADGDVSLDAYINLGTDIPKLAPGTNTVTTTGNITECKLTPRWWKL